MRNFLLLIVGVVVAVTLYAAGTNRLPRVQSVLQKFVEDVKEANKNGALQNQFSGIFSTACRDLDSALTEPSATNGVVSNAWLSDKLKTLDRQVSGDHTGAPWVGKWHYESPAGLGSFTYEFTAYGKARMYGPMVNASGTYNEDDGVLNVTLKGTGPFGSELDGTEHYDWEREGVYLRIIPQSNGNELKLYRVTN
jgi:hypothetical protein